jgi:hypothetical protein
MKMEKEIKKKKTISKKIFLFGILPILLLGTIFAGAYLVKSMFIQSDVYEPFSVEYSILGDGSSYTEGLCADAVYTAMPETTLDVQGLYAGESRKICFKITNLAEAEVDYTISNTVTGGDACLSAFGENSVSGVASNGINYAGKLIEVSDGATPVNDCVIQIDVNRG